MSDESTEKPPVPHALARARRLRQPVWPLILVVLLLAALIVGAAFSLLRSRTGDEPWRIDYPGVTWVQGVDTATQEGKRYLQAEVRFDREVVSAYELKTFLAKLVGETNNVYEYYHIKVVNRNGVHVLDGVADKTGLHSISVTNNYPDQ